MASLRNWWVRLGAVLGTAALAVFVPVAAWASTAGTGDVVLEAARRRGVGAGVFGLFCCALVVAIVVVLVVLLMRRRGGRR